MFQKCCINRNTHLTCASFTWDTFWPAVFYVIPKDIPDSFLSTYLPPFFGQIHQRVSEVKNMFKSIFDMGHKYVQCNRPHTHIHTRHTWAPKLTWMHACTNIRTAFVCVFLSHFVFFFYFGTRTDAVALYAQIESLQRTMKEKRKRKTLKPCKRIINLLVWSNWTTVPTIAPEL